jgi:hypothetical protein
MTLVLALFGAVRATFQTHGNLVLENLELRQQLALLRRGSKRPQFGRLDRLLRSPLLRRPIWSDEDHGRRAPVESSLGGGDAKIEFWRTTKAQLVYGACSPNRRAPWPERRSHVP